MAFGGVPCVNVGAPAGQMTWGQTHSDAGIDLSQSILFLLMSQQQHPLSTGGWTGGAARAEAPNTSTEMAAANESVFMMLCFFSFAFSVIDLCFLPLLVSFAAGGGPSAFILTVSYLQGRPNVSESKTVWGNQHSFLSREEVRRSGLRTRKDANKGRFLHTKIPGEKQKMKRSS